MEFFGTYRGYDDPALQTLMILDEVRTQAYAEAIAKVVQPGDVVLDVGAGSGLLSLFAAKAGARKVYAVERTAMVRMIRELAEENGVSDRIEIIRSDLEDIVELAEKPTVLVSEMLGHFAHDEDQHRLYQRALRLCAPDARTIPRSYQVKIAPARPDEHDHELELLGGDVGLGVTMRAMQRRMQHRVSVREVPPEDLLGEEARSEAIAVAAPTPDHFAFRCTMDEDGPVTALVASFIADLADGVQIDTSTWSLPTHWQQVVFPVTPALACREGDELEIDLWPRVSVSRGTWAWRVRVGEEVREGDALDSYVGDDIEIEEQLARGAKRSRIGERGDSKSLRAWAAMLGGNWQQSVDEMTDRVMAAMPHEYADRADARQEVLRFLEAVEALR